MNEIIRVKPHHFVDIVCSLGADDLSVEPSDYGHHVHVVKAKAMQNKNIMLEMDLGADDICRPCKHNKNGLCDDIVDKSRRPEPGIPSSKREWTLIVDRRWCEKTGLKQGDRLSAKEFCEKIQNTVTDTDIKDIYREVSENEVKKKYENLKAGINKYF